jgi:hypothetical protein
VLDRIFQKLTGNDLPGKQLLSMNEHVERLSTKSELHWVGSLLEAYTLRLTINLMSLTEDQISRCQAIFTQFDKDHSGRIDRFELRVVMERKS